MSVDLARLPGIDLRGAQDGNWYALWRKDGFEHRFSLPVAPPPCATSYCAILPLDDLAGPAASAASALWRAIADKTPIGRIWSSSPSARLRHTLILRALDGRRDGASYRHLAEVLLGFRGTKEDWEDDRRRNEIRRIVKRGQHYLEGGYRGLLYPQARRRR